MARPYRRRMTATTGPWHGPAGSTTDPGRQGKQCVPMSRTTIDGVVLDHVAHAVPQWRDVWHRYAVDLGAEWSSGGLAIGFAPGQIEFANGARLELLMPNDVERQRLPRPVPGQQRARAPPPDLQGSRPGPGHRTDPPSRVRTHRHRSQRPRVDGGVHPPEAGHRSRGPAGPGARPVDRSRARRLPDRAAAATGPERTRPHPARCDSGTHAVADSRWPQPSSWDSSEADVTAQGDRRRPPLDGTFVGWAGGTPPGQPRPAVTASPLARWLAGRSGRIHHLGVVVRTPGRSPGPASSGGLPLGADGRHRRRLGHPAGGERGDAAGAPRRREWGGARPTAGKRAGRPDPTGRAGPVA